MQGDYSNERLCAICFSDHKDSVKYKTTSLAFDIAELTIDDLQKVGLMLCNSVSFQYKNLYFVFNTVMITAASIGCAVV